MIRLDTLIRMIGLNRQNKKWRFRPKMAKKSVKAKPAKLEELVEYYEVCNMAENKSEETIKWYSENLKRFLRYLKGRHLPCTLEAVDIKLLREYVLHLKTKKKYESHPVAPKASEPLSPATIHGHVRTLRAFFNWLSRDPLDIRCVEER
jgi:site-specific recombinase XerD